MKYKVVDHWSYKGFNVVTEAMFDPQGIYSIPMSKHIDAVRIRTVIYNPITKKLEEYDDGHSCETVFRVKGKWYQKRERKVVSIAENYNTKMENVYEDNLYHVQRLHEAQEITNGLPDSLKNL